jgi:ATP-dependent Clp protease ATP-binding subunit ClpC
MHETFTRTLRQALARAQTKARDLNQDFVSTEHLLLGVLDEGTGEAVRLLQLNDIATGPLQSAMVRGLPCGKETPVVTGDLPLTPRAQRAINLAIVKAQSLQERSVSTRMVLIALLDEPGTALHQALGAAGADLDKLMNALMRKPEKAEP